MKHPIIINDGLVEEATRWRHHIHAHPETAFEEHGTADFIAQKLESFGLEVHRGLGGTGVVGTLRKGTSDRAVGLRADMDALFIHEESDLAYRSTVPGKMHACGHDGHSAMLLGAARHLAQEGDFDGIVRFIFQPAEETGDEHCGGNAMVKDGLFERFPVSAIFGLHNFPSMPVGQFATRAGPMLGSIDTFEFHVTSALAHPGTQFTVADPLLTAARIVQDIHLFKARYVNPSDPVVLSITQFQSGDPQDRQSVHVTPSRAVVRGTLYCLDEGVRDSFELGIARIVEHGCESAGAMHEYRFERGYPVLINAARETAMAATAAAEVVGADQVDSSMKPVMVAEDFAFMLQQVPGCYIVLGGGGLETSCAGLHNAHYDFNDRIIETGIRYWVTLAQQYLAAEPAG